MKVINRKGEFEDIDFNKVHKRINEVAKKLNITTIDTHSISKEVISGFEDNMPTSKIDNLTAEVCAGKATINPLYSILAGGILVSNNHKSTHENLQDYINHIANNSELLHKDFYNVFIKYAPQFDFVDYSRDYSYDYFAYRTLERAYLIKINGQVVERIQQMLLRCAVQVHLILGLQDSNDFVAKVKETYELLSEKYYTHATPTLYNAGTQKPQLSSCFLLDMKEDSISGIYDTLKQCALISQSAGGIGLSIHNIRATGSHIKGTNGTSNGIVPMLRVFNDTARYVDQGGGKRKGGFAIYLETWHADIFDFLPLRKNHGKEEMRARDLFLALWISDLFMERVEKNEDWSLFCPNEAKGLQDVYGEEFEKLYIKYEKQGLARKVVKARELWNEILDAQIETGTPYMLYKDSSNRKSNQQNLGTIKSSNLCAEILEYTSKDEVAVCNLASIALPKFLENGSFNHQKLFEVTKVVAKNLDNVIDVNFYPVIEAKNSNFRHRPIGIGVQGLADLFALLRISFDSEQAQQLNKEIFETIYFGAITASKELAQEKGTYSSYENSPISKGIFQFDMWNVKPTNRWDWQGLREEILKYGVRNSLSVAIMPTASTSQILGNNECIEPITSNVYLRRTSAGEFPMINKYLVKELDNLGLWNESMKNQIIAHNGSIQNIKNIPQEIKDIYKTAWEISQKSLINMSADRGAYICQSQSLNIFMQDANSSKLTSMHFYAWRKGLKTGMYYLRTKSAVDAIKFTIDKTATQEKTVCSIDDPNCDSCGA